MCFVSSGVCLLDSLDRVELPFGDAFIYLGGVHINFALRTKMISVGVGKKKYFGGLKQQKCVLSWFQRPEILE